jgi:regulator of sigma E protease
MGVFVGVLVLSFLVFFHELGHFIIARLLGVKVEVFSVGFGKKLFSKKYGDTEYRIAMIPLGGYVQMKGQDDLEPISNNYEKDSYMSKTPFQRILILLGGPIFNILLAFLIYCGVALNGYKRLAPEIGGVIPNSSAVNVLKKGDLILSINSRPIKSWNDIKKVIENVDDGLNIQIKRENSILKLRLNPTIMKTKNIFQENVKRKLIGIFPSGKTLIIHYSFKDALLVAFDETLEKSKLIFVGFIKMVSGVIGVENISGPVTIMKVTSDATQYGLVAVLLLSALISVNLGILNLLPIPALDGGHIIFNLYEMVTNKQLNENIKINLTIGGWIVLGILMFIGFYNDIIRLIGG